MDDKEKVHTRRLLLFKYRLNKITLEKGYSLEDIGKKINDNFLDDVKYKDSTFNGYALSEPLKEPNILVAIGTAYTLEEDLNYLFGLDWGELVYHEPLTVSSLLTNLFRALKIGEGIHTRVDYNPNETIITPTNKYFRNFFEKINLDGTMESNFPVLFQIILDYMQDKANTRIDTDHLLSKINKIPKLIYEREVYLPMAWEMILDALPTELRPKSHRGNPYSSIDKMKGSKKKEVLRNFRENLLNILINKKIVDWNISNRELAKRIQVREETIGHYLNDIHIPSVNNLIDIALALDISIEYLLGFDNGSGKFPSLTTLESKFLNLFKALKYANFKIRENKDQTKVAYSDNPYIHKFLAKTSDVQNINEAYKIIEEALNPQNLYVDDFGEIEVYDANAHADWAKNIMKNLKLDANYRNNFDNSKT